MTIIFMDTGEKIELSKIDWEWLASETASLRRYVSEDDHWNKKEMQWFGPRFVCEELYLNRLPSRQFRRQIDEKIESLLK